MKTEPDSYSIDDLKREGIGRWDGVRNYQARNFIRDDMRTGDQVLFYHSSTKIPGVAGIAEIVKDAYPDPTAFDRKSQYFDPRSTKKDPRWYVVDVRHVRSFESVIPLAQLRTEKQLRGMALLRPGQRLSVQPVTKEEFKHIINLADEL